MELRVSIFVTSLVAGVIALAGLYLIRNSQIDDMQDSCTRLSLVNDTFRCKSDNNCLDQTQVCNGKKDCSDGSDEYPDFCGDCKPTNANNGRMYRCLQTGRCITAAHLCNFQEDCPDGSDEVDCIWEGENMTTMFDDPTDAMKWKPVYEFDQLIRPDREMESGSVENHIQMKLHLQAERFFFEVDQGKRLKELKCSVGRDGNGSMEQGKPHGCNVSKGKLEVSVRIQCERESLASASAVGQPWTQIPWNNFTQCASIVSIFQGMLATKALMPWKFPAGNAKQSYKRLTQLDINGNNIQGIATCAFCHLGSLTSLRLKNNKIENLEDKCFDMLSLELLQLSRNELARLPSTLGYLPNLKVLMLDQNKISDIPNGFFQGFSSLWFLDISHNDLKTISSHLFFNNCGLKYINLSFNKLNHLSADAFASPNKISSLNITHNRKLILNESLTKNLAQLRRLDISSFETSQFTHDTFAAAKNLIIVIFRMFEYCSFAPKVKRCYPHTNGISSWSRLLISNMDTIALVFGIFTIAGNVMVLITRFWKSYLAKSPGLNVHSDIPRTVNIFVCNLSLADFLMGIYLLALVYESAETKGKYMQVAYEWVTSWRCTGIGILAIVSSEVSMITLTLMSLDMYLANKKPCVKGPYFSPGDAHVAMLLVWIICILLAIAPAMYFENAIFYGSTGLCFPIHLDTRFPDGWMYTMFLFVGINTACLAVISYSYFQLFRTAKQSPSDVRRNMACDSCDNKSLKMAKNLFLLIFTDVLCWAPVILMKLCVLFGYKFSEGAIALAVVLILPINSAVNPFLYTFRALLFTTQKSNEQV